MYNYLWITMGPRGVIATKNTLAILQIPIIYLAYTTMHGLAIQQWPYKFLDLTSEGFVEWLLGVAVIFSFGIVLIRLYSKLDRKQKI